MDTNRNALNELKADLASNREKIRKSCAGQRNHTHQSIKVSTTCSGESGYCLINAVETQGNTAMESSKKVLNNYNQSLIHNTGEQFTQLKAELELKQRRWKRLYWTALMQLSKLNNNKSALESVTKV